MMRFRLSSAIAVVVAVAGLTGCSGGSPKGAALSASCSGADANVLCLSNCSLGCRTDGCEITEIAQNENIVLTFSRNVDPNTVNATTIQFRTASGAEPVGEFLVNGQVVEFVPQVLVVGGQSFFGFQAGETYTMTLPGGPGEINSLRSTAGDPLEKTLRCTLNVSRGIIDLNGVPPAARMLTPRILNGAPRDSVIVLEFNELIDITPFLGTSGASSPIVFAARRTRTGANNEIECSPISQPVVLAGTSRVTTDPQRGVSVVTFTPATILPGSLCVEVNVTDRVRDLSGRAATPQVFQFITETAQTVELDYTQEFDEEDDLDRNASSGTWGNGVATFGAIGGDGRHGTFEPAIGQSLGQVGGRDTYLFDTDNTVIPGRNTLSGQPIAVTDGKFFFEEMVVPSSVRLVFTGSNPPQFTVRGRCEIQGIIDVAGTDTAYLNFTAAGPTVPVAGVDGGAGGVFGGRGGKGGDRCVGNGPLPAMNGQNGQDCRVLAGHAYFGQTVNTGGRGSTLFPPHGTFTGLIFGTGPVTYNLEAAAGGGGGGLFTGGAPGRVVSNSVNDPTLMGPPAPGGAAFPVLPIPAGAANSQHFLVGGSGGGGSGSESLFAISVTRAYAPGNGGAGGGGAISFRAGDTLRMSALASISARGGSCGSSPTGIIAGAQTSPAGAGSGGSVVLQAGRIGDLQGAIDVRGGTGGRLNRTSPSPTNGTVVIEGGNGSPGFVRYELAGGATPAQLPGMQPAATADNVGALTEVDPRSGFRSIFVSTDQAFGPQFTRYEIRALIDGQPVVFSDDPAFGTPALPGLAPIEAYFQCGTVDLSSGAVDPNSIRPWRQAVGSFGGVPGIAEDALNGFRFLLLVDRTSGQQIQIDSIKVFYRV